MKKEHVSSSVKKLVPVLLIGIGFIAQTAGAEERSELELAFHRATDATLMSITTDLRKALTTAKTVPDIRSERPTKTDTMMASVLKKPTSDPT